MDDLNDMLGEWMRDFFEQVAKAREQAVEQSLQDGQRGVLEVWHRDGSVAFALSHDVPYGRVYVIDERWLKAV